MSSNLGLLGKSTKENDQGYLRDTTLARIPGDGVDDASTTE